MLQMATRQLRERWTETKGSWRDRKAQEFEETYLGDLTESVNAALRVMEEMDKLLEKIHGDCE